MERVKEEKSTSFRTKTRREVRPRSYFFRSGIEMTENEISKEIVDVAYHLHRQYGPGLLESVYECLMEYELKKRGFNVRRQVPVPLVHEGITIYEAFKADLLVAEKVIVELKAAESMHSVYKRQLLTHLKIADIKLGLLINFGMDTIKEGIVRMVNGPLETATSPT